MGFSFTAIKDVFLNYFKQKRCPFDYLCAFLLFLLIPILMGFSSVWYEWYSLEPNGLWMKRLYELVDGHWMVNVPLSIIVICFSLSYCRKLYKDNSFRPFRLPLLLIGFVLLNWNAPVKYARIVFGFDYRELITSLLCVVSLVCFIGFCRKISQKYKSANIGEGCTGFSADSIKDEDLPEGLKTYASSIADRLVGTDVTNNSFAIGITGEWGVGKTTFLNLLKEKIKYRMEVVEFNPWMCRTPEQVTHDFFVSLRNQLSPKYSILSKSIKDYARHINALTISHSALSIDLSNFAGENSLSQKKEELSSKFGDLPKPVAIIVDDLDRLEKDEVFEVIRLIRNTADLRNIIYIVAYDKEYITTILEERKIKNASSYLEKIFPVEVHLPKVEEYLIWETLRNDIQDQNDLHEHFAEKLFKQFNSQDKELILRVLDNYRRAKRFSRLYMLNAKYLMEHCAKDIRPIDFFWLELLQVYDKKTYDVLANNPHKLLYCYGDRFRVRNGVSQSVVKNDSNMYTGERFWKDETPSLLDKMFGNHIKTNITSICNIENYSKYFVLGVSKFKLSIKEFQTLFKEHSDPEELVHKWLDDGKYYSSLLYHLKHVNLDKLKDNDIQSFIHAVMCFGMRIAPYYNSGASKLKDILRATLYIASGKKGQAQSAMTSWLDKKIDDKCNLLQLSKFLNILYITQNYDEEDNKTEISPLLITNQQVEEYLVKVMGTFLKSDSSLKANDVLKEDSKLAYLFRNCCVRVDGENLHNNYGSYKQVAFDVVISYFSSKEIDIKPTKAEFDRLNRDLFVQETPVFTNPLDEDDYWEYISEKVDRMKATYFGDNYTVKLREFKDNCFI